MADVVHDVQQDFWKSPALEPAAASPLAPAVPEMAAACDDCGTEFMIGARFCHVCGQRRPLAASDAEIVASHWSQGITILRETALVIGDGVRSAWRRIPFPSWMQYLHFHEIQAWVGLPTASFIAFMIGLGCVAGAIGVSLFYKASNLAEFQAIQMWRIEWLLGATASFVAGILLKKPSRD
jgi:hypothetical protein